MGYFSYIMSLNHCHALIFTRYLPKKNVFKLLTIIILHVRKHIDKSLKAFIFLSKTSNTLILI